jgi:hypothetical protein
MKPTKEELKRKALEFLSNRGYGSGNVFTVVNVAELMTAFAIDNKPNDKNEQVCANCDLKGCDDCSVYTEIGY